MVSILVGTNAFRAAMSAVLVHACTDPDFDSLCRVRVDIGPNGVTITATDMFTSGLAVVPVFSHLADDLEETDIPWAATIDLPVTGIKDLLMRVLKTGRDNGDDPDKLTRIVAAADHVEFTDASGLIDGRSVKLERLDTAGDTFPDIERAIYRIAKGHPTLLEDVGFVGKNLVRFRAATTAYDQPVLVEATTTSRALLIACGGAFLGSIMPIPHTAEHTERTREWRANWMDRWATLPDIDTEGTAA